MKNKNRKTFWTLLFLFIILFIVLMIIRDKKETLPNHENEPNKTVYESKLHKIGYNEEEIKILKNKLNKNEIKEIESKQYDKNIPKLVNDKYFIYENFERYLDYLQKENKSIEKTVMEVDIGIDKPCYTNVTEVTDPNNLLVIVNKYYKLSDTYKPNDLVQLSESNQSLRKEAAEHIEKLKEDMKNDGLDIITQSGFRTYETQKYLYDKYVDRDGVDEADTYSARPGHSEHQTGLTIDLSHDGTLETNFENTKQFKWLQDNAYKYGFIMRYPKDKVYLTGYSYEPWHYRYVGKEVAKIIHDEKITLEEYCIKYILFKET